MKFIIASFWSKSLDEVATYTWPTKENYAKRHGYPAIHGYHEPGVDVMWDRPRQWANVLDQAEDGTHCLFMGCDTAITRPDLPLENWIDNNHDAFVLVDNLVVFGDVHVWKASPATRHFMRAIADRKHPKAWHELTEQDAFTSAMATTSRFEYQRKALDGAGGHGTPEYYVRAQAALNAGELNVKLLNLTDFAGDDPAQWPPNELPKHYCWSRNHLILHMGGISNERRITLMKDILADQKAMAL